MRPNGNALHDVQEEAEHFPSATVESGELSPGTQERFDSVKQTMDIKHQREAEEKEAESIRRLDELMRYSSCSCMVIA